MSGLRLSIAIATRDRPEALEACLRSIAAQEYRPWEVLVIDQSRRNQSARVEAILSPAALSFRYHHAPELSGLTHARNVGIELAAGDVILFVDDDVELLPGYLHHLVSAFEEDLAGRIGGASGYTINFTQTLSLAQRVRSAIFYRGPFAVEGDPIAFHLRPGRGPRRTRRLHGSNMAFRRTVLDSSQFDTAYTGYSFGEDRDFCATVQGRFDLIWIPEARLIHRVASTSRLDREAFCELRVLSWLRFYQRHVPRSLQALLSYLWLNVGFATLLLAVWDPPTVRGTYRGLRRLVEVLRGRESIDGALKSGWHPTPLES